MGAPVSYDWIFLAAGWSVAGLAAVLLLWALFWDRPRGRRRCPKCWYDMAGVPGLRCPECGRESRRERKLHRTHRRWRWATVWLLALVAGVVAARVPSFRQGGWAGQVPTTALILGLKWWDSPRNRPPLRPSWNSAPPQPAAPTWRETLYQETIRRVGDGRLWKWQTSLLVQHIVDGDEERPTGSVAWALHYRNLSGLIWSQYYDRPRGATLPRVPITDRSLDIIGGLETIHSFRVERRAGDRAIVSCIHIPTRGLLQIASDHGPGQPLAWCALPPGRRWPWGDGYTGPFDIAASGGVPVVVRQLDWVSGNEELWRIHLILSVQQEPPAGVPPVESEKVAAALEKHLTPGLSLKPTYGLVPTLWLRAIVDEIAEAVPERVTLAVRLEALRDGEVFATGEAWWHPHSDGRIYGQLAWPGGELISLQLAKPGEDLRAVARGGTWTLRVTGDDQVARREPSVAAYWKGSVTVPLTLRADGPPWPSDTSVGTTTPGVAPR